MGTCDDIATLLERRPILRFSEGSCKARLSVNPQVPRYRITGPALHHSSRITLGVGGRSAAANPSNRLSRSFALPNALFKQSHPAFSIQPSAVSRQQLAASSWHRASSIQYPASSIAQHSTLHTQLFSLLTPHSSLVTIHEHE